MWAVAVLFLFVVMMLDINFVELRQGFMQYLPIGALLRLILLVELFFVIGIWSFAEDGSMLATVVPIQNTTNTHALGNVLYTKYVYLFHNRVNPPHRYDWGYSSYTTEPARG